MEMTLFADLHNHTNASDGDFTPKALVEKAKGLGIRALGITDHDTLKGLEEALATGDDLGVQVIPGVEVSIRFKRPYFTGTLHLLCYFSRKRLEDNGFINDFQAVLAGGRGQGLVKARVAQINKVFGPKGQNPLLMKNMTVEDIEKLSPNASRRHFALALAQTFDIDDKQTINQIIGNDSPAYLPSGIELETAASFIRSNDLTAVLAHPAAGSFPGKGHYKEVLPDIEIVEKMLPEFIDIGIKGLEVKYPGHTKEHQDILMTWVEKYGLFITGGSDCHDETERPPGAAGITESEFNIFNAAIS